MQQLLVTDKQAQSLLTGEIIAVVALTTDRDIRITHVTTPSRAITLAVEQVGGERIHRGYLVTLRFSQPFTVAPDALLSQEVQRDTEAALREGPGVADLNWLVSERAAVRHYLAAGATEATMSAAKRVAEYVESRCPGGVAASRDKAGTPPKAETSLKAVAPGELKTIRHEYDGENGSHRIVTEAGHAGSWSGSMFPALLVINVGEGHREERYVAFPDAFADPAIINKVWKMEEVQE